MNKILHLFRREKFTSAFIYFINENFQNDYHEFWIYGKVSRSLELPIYKNVKHVNDISTRLMSGKIYQFDKIIYHGVFEAHIIDYFVHNRKLLNKLYLYFWGGDKFYIKDIRGNFKKKYLIRNAHGIITIIPEEYRFLKKHYHFKGTYFCAKYNSDKVVENLKRLSNENVENDVTKIILGNSATPSNNHIAVLHKLSKFKDENIELYLPLSYGEKEYAQKVMVEGKKIFGDKFVPVTDFMKEDDYYAFLNHMDIGIFDMNRQQALGNISALLALGKKIYLKSHSVLAHYYRIENHCDIWTTDEIESMAFKDFISFKHDSIERNKEIMRHMYLKESRIEAWRKVFNDVIKND